MVQTSSWIKGLVLFYVLPSWNLKKLQHTKCADHSVLVLINFDRFFKLIFGENGIGKSDSEFEIRFRFRFSNLPRLRKLQRYDSERSIVGFAFSCLNLKLWRENLSEHQNELLSGTGQRIKWVPFLLFASRNGKKRIGIESLFANVNLRQFILALEDFC